MRLNSAFVVLLSIASVKAFIPPATVLPSVAGTQKCSLHASAVNENSPSNRKAPRNLYEVLRAPKDATTAELKKHYRTRAKETHPDAQYGRENKADTSDEFNAIAEAWQTLSDKKERQRYDRTLRAEEIKETVEEAASKVSQSAAPRMKKVMDVAIPFLRRTTVTTVSAVSAAADGLTRNGSNGGKKVDIGSAVKSAIRAGRAASRIVDGMELFEKAVALEER